MSEDTGSRLEHDTLGEVAVPVGARWGAQTQRAVENFAVSGRPVPPALVRALARVKGAAARANGALGVLDPDVATAIAEAADRIAAGELADQFPVDVFQTGSGTSTNMNANEVLASLAAERLGRAVHPNDDVNASQSSNDVFPTAVHVAVYDAVADRLLPALAHLAATLRRRAGEHAATVKAARTHLMDAVPITFGAELAGHARVVELGIERLRGTFPRLAELPLGGTAAGTGLNCPPGFAPDAIARLSAATGLPLREAADHVEAQSRRDALVEVSATCRTVALGVLKLANDLRWLSSGPATGLGEITLPALQPGSSIMPGKVNPVVPEAVAQVVAQVVGNDAAVAFAAGQGAFQLDVMLPVTARNVLESIELLANAVRLLADRAVAGLVADTARMARYAASSPAVATALNPLLGYEAVAGVVHRALASGRTIREVVLAEGLLDAETLDAALDLAAMAGVRPPPAS